VKEGEETKKVVKKRVEKERIERETEE